MKESEILLIRTLVPDSQITTPSGAHSWAVSSQANKETKPKIASSCPI